MGREFHKPLYIVRRYLFIDELDCYMGHMLLDGSKIWQLPPRFDGYVTHKTNMMPPCCECLEV